MIPDRFPAYKKEELPNRKSPVSAGMNALPHEHDPLLDSEQAAQRLKIHPKTLQRYARQGYVHGFQIGTMWRFRTSDIERWIAQQAS